MLRVWNYFEQKDIAASRLDFDLFLSTHYFQDMHKIVEKFVSFQGLAGRHFNRRPTLTYTSAENKVFMTRQDGNSRLLQIKG